MVCATYISRLKVLITIYPPTFYLFPFIPHPLLYSSLIQSFYPVRFINPLPLSLVSLCARMCAIAAWLSDFFTCHLCAVLLHI
jgi:hypothetical protein